MSAAKTELSKTELSKTEPSKTEPSTTDLLVVGAGAFGLWCARRAQQAGLKTRVVEARRIGAGASGGVLGALTAHTPDRWSEKKAFQLAALASLPAEIAALEAETGLSAGYARCGRVMPIRTAAFRAQVEARRQGAATHWAPTDPSFVYEAREEDDAAAAPGGGGSSAGSVAGSSAPPDHASRAVAGWLALEAARFGYVWDGLAARVAPRAYLRALAASVNGVGAAMGAGSAAASVIEEGARFLALEPPRLGGRARLSSGERVAAGAVILAAGFENAWLHPSLAAAAAPLGGVKGRALLLRLPGFEARPLLYEDGLYVAPHADGRVAVGSTDEPSWGEALSPAAEGAQRDDGAEGDDGARLAEAEAAYGAGAQASREDAATEALIARAAALCPPAAGAAVEEVWAGVRPKMRSRDPLFGPLEEDERLWVAGGGFKIGFGVAHRVAAAVIDRMTGAAAPTPGPARFWTDGAAEPGREADLRD